MNNQLQILKKKTYKNHAFNEFGELIPSKSRNFVEYCQSIKNLLGSLAHLFFLDH